MTSLHFVYYFLHLFHPLRLPWSRHKRLAAGTGGTVALLASLTAWVVSHSAQRSAHRLARMKYRSYMVNAPLSYICHSDVAPDKPRNTAPATAAVSPWLSVMTVVSALHSVCRCRGSSCSMSSGQCLSAAISGIDQRRQSCSTRITLRELAQARRLPTQPFSGLTTAPSVFPRPSRLHWRTTTPSIEERDFTTLHIA